MKKLIMMAASAATMVAFAASPAMAQSFSTTDNSINDSFNDNSTSTQVQTQSSTVFVSQSNTAASGDATASGDGSIAFSGASVFAPVSVFQTSVQTGGDFFVFFY